jgi:hypothetical protein
MEGFKRPGLSFLVGILVGALLGLKMMVFVHHIVAHDRGVPVGAGGQKPAAERALEQEKSTLTTEQEAMRREIEQIGKAVGKMRPGRVINAAPPLRTAIESLPFRTGEDKLEPTKRKD